MVERGVKKFSRREFLKACSLVAISFLAGTRGCGKIEAITLPYGKNSCVQIFWGDAVNNPEIKKHEDYHCKQIKEEGTINFIKNYFENPCKYELEASQGKYYPGCSEK